MLYKFVLRKKKKFISNKKMERGKISIDLDSKPLSKSSLLLNIEKKKIVQDFELNLLAYREFDLNNFTEEGEEAFEEKEIQKVVSILLKIYLPNFY